jgi:hypothetical protein
MTTNHFHAVDANGVVHTRSSKSRVYTHTVVSKPSYGYALAAAQSPDWTKTDRRNLDYYDTIAQGRDPYPRKCYRQDHPEKWTPEQIEEERVAVEAENARRVQEAIDTVANRTVEQWLADKKAERIERVEKLKAEGYYDSWGNAGWCGRFDLAQKLAHAEKSKAHVAEVAILVAEPGKAAKAVA